MLLQNKILHPEGNQKPKYKKKKLLFTKVTEIQILMVEVFLKG
jgi:hypothetical protein